METLFASRDPRLMAQPDVESTSPTTQTLLRSCSHHLLLQKPELQLFCFDCTQRLCISPLRCAIGSLRLRLMNDQTK